MDKKLPLLHLLSLQKKQWTAVEKKTYFGLAALVSGILCVLSLLANYGVANLNISRETFNQLNNLTTLFYCVLTQATVVLGVLGHARRNDSKKLSWTGIVLAVIPFLFTFARLAYSFIFKQIIP